MSSSVWLHGIRRVERAGNQNLRDREELFDVFLKFLVVLLT